MCVIAYSPPGVAVPSKAELEKMFKKNPHGAGFAITRPDGFTEWHKGYMEFDDFMEKLGEFSDELLEDCPTTLHFRITTKGNTDPETTHPFPVSPQFSDMRKLHGITQGPVAFHNGTITGFGGIGAKVSSDSQDFVMGPMFYIMKGVTPDRGIGALRKAAIEQLIGSSRLLVMMSNQDVYRFGSNWTKHTDGCYYSNMLWNPVEKKVNTTYPYSYKQETKKIPAVSTVDPWEKIEPLKREPDEWGCHSYPGVWPAKGREWLEFENANVRETAIRFMDEVTVKGVKGYKHKQSGNIYYPSGETSLLTDEGFRMMSDYYIDTYGNTEDDIDDMVKDGNIEFPDLERLHEFLELIDSNEDGSYEYENERWFVDLDTFSMYTEDFLMAYFDKDIEEVKKSLLEKNCIDEKLLEDEDEEEATVEEKLEEVATRVKAATA